MLADVQVKMMIVTARKEKIGHTMSYPVGAGEISRFAGEFPQHERTSIRFSGQAVYWASQWNEIIRNQTPYRVLEYSYTSGTEAPAEDSSNITWMIRVYPVLRSLRASAHEGILNVALPALSHWLLETATSKGRRRVPSLLRFQFDPVEKSIRRV